MNAIPTVYKSIRFRSRLEATWAAFFDGCRWPWSYEPIDLDGYIPDFILRFPHAPLLVEVKPALYFAELTLFTGKIERSGWTDEALIVGSGPFITLGLLAERMSNEWCWDEAWFFRCEGCGHLSLCHSVQSFHCRRTGCHDGDHHISPAVFEDSAETLWAQAQNTTQYRRP